MDGTRAFKLPVPPVDFVVIDEKALFAIKDIAHKIDQNDFGAALTRHHRIMFQALRDYLALRGATPRFEVKL